VDLVARKLTHLRALEAESIHILREAVAEFENPVMMYSIGKDSSVMLRLAQKAFAPAKLPFPLLHIDTTWKFREMIAHRDRVAREMGVELIVYTNLEGLAQNINPFDHGSNRYTTVMKTEALKQALSKYQFDCAFGGAPRRGALASQRARLLVSGPVSSVGPQKPAPRAVVSLQRANQPAGERARLSALELDRARRVALHLVRRDSDRPALPGRASAGRRTRGRAHHGG